jgi:DNA topoisomerase I
MSLVIVESPGKCKTIQGYLGHGWRVMASMGHLRALVPSLDSVGITKQFEPTYEWIKEKAATIKALKEAAKEATEIYVAADDDREGEFIAYSVCLLLKLNPKTVKRAVFHEITEAAIQHAIHHPRHMDMDRVHAQQARSMLDMMIGFTISPLLWKYVAPSLSAGRCQTPALRLVVEREDAIQSFQATSSWKLTATMRLASSSSPSFGITMDDELEDEESAQNYLELVHATPTATVLQTSTKPWTESAPDPLMTSTLQQQASALFHMNPQSTMRIAQSLYEAGHITYMRTDQAVLSEDVKREAREWVTTHVGPHYVSGDTSFPHTPVETQASPHPSLVETLHPHTPLSGDTSFPHTPLPWRESVAAGDLKPPSASGGLKGAAVPAQQAHEAIRPTHITTLQAGKDAQEQKIYRLIWQRTIQSVMSSARGETDHMTCQIDDEFRWSTSWRRTIHEGWKRIGQVANLDDQEEEKEVPRHSLVPGDRLEWTTMKAEPKETKAQGRYTEAQLVRALETHGIGRPSTFASLLSVIQEKKYVECVDLPPRPVPVKEWSIVPHQWPPTVTALVKQAGAEKKKMVPTPLGRAALHFLLTHVEDLFAYAFTAHMERRLDAIAEGTERGATLLADIWRSYQDRYEGLLQGPKGIQGAQGQQGAQVAQGPSGQSQDHVKRRTFSGGLLAVQTKKGPLLLKEDKAGTVFYGWPKKATWDSLTDEEAHAFVKSHVEEHTNTLGEWKGTPLIRKKGKFGEYVQWGTISVSLVQGESLEALQARLEAKEAGGVLATFASYVIRNGPYGPYIIKTSVQKKQFVSLPKGVDPAALTEKEVAALYQLGLQSKKKRPS